jgi:hypothetical protein
MTARTSSIPEKRRGHRQRLHLHIENDIGDSLGINCDSSHTAGLAPFHRCFIDPTSRVIRPRRNRVRIQNCKSPTVYRS